MEGALVGVTMGDPCGIGPELCLKALATPFERSGSRFVLLGCPAVVSEMLQRLGLELTVETVSEPGKAGSSPSRVYVFETVRFGPVGERFGQVLEGAGQAALDTIEAAASMACTGELSAVATAPVSKESLHMAGSTVPGHAEIFARRAGVEGVATMLSHDDFRVVHLTTHVSLRRACELVKQPRIVEVARLTDQALSAMGLSRPRIALAALNPHGGDGGLFGREEMDEIEPAATALRQEGLDVTGPIPADIVYPQARGGMWDAVVAMYHDQGHIPIKTASFTYNRETGRWESTGGVTLTLGLPFPRTSVDHGTAFDIAGTGAGDAGAMVGALELAARLVR